jgi:hypothetical protein
MPHKFKLGQIVRLQASFAALRSGSADIYEVIRLMPADQSGEYSYRVKSAGAERAARESELRLA